MYIIQMYFCINSMEKWENKLANDVSSIYLFTFISNLKKIKVYYNILNYNTKITLKIIKLNCEQV